LRRKRDLLLSISGVGETLASVVLAELPGLDVLRSSAEVVAYAGLNPRQHQSGTSIDRVTRMSAMRYNPAIVALVTRLKSRGRLKPKQIVVAAMRKLLVLCFGVLKTGKPFDRTVSRSAVQRGQRAPVASAYPNRSAWESESPHWGEYAPRRHDLVTVAQEGKARSKSVSTSSRITATASKWSPDVLRPIERYASRQHRGA
jgi:hypothetical protein